MLLEIRYVNRFDYPEPARESHNVLRACPTADGNQRLIDYRVVVEPAARMLSYVDFWGTRVDAFGIRQPHQYLQVAAHSVVETGARPEPRESGPFSEYRRGMVGNGEYLRRTGHTDWGKAIQEAARSSIDGAGSAVEAVAAINAAVAGSLRYVSGVTEVGTDINHIFEQGEGVCQDFAHLGVAMCRAVGIPARYVSGYFYAADSSVGAMPETAEIEVQTHAWVEALIPGWGWWAFDPTNPEPVGERHVKIGHGRDYDDVAPLRGVYHGPAEHGLGVSVQMSREALSAMEQQQ